MTVTSADVASQINRLVNTARTSDAPPSVNDAVAQLVEQARGLLDEHRWRGPYAVEQLAPPGEGFLVWDADDLRKTVPYSPMFGALNPVAVPSRLWADRDAVHGRITFAPMHAGPIGTVHGGVIAALFDELTNLAVLAAGGIGYTRTLTVTYLKPTPLDAEVDLWAHTAGQSGDRFLTTAEIRCGGTVTASATGVHKAAGARTATAYPSRAR